MKTLFSALALLLLTHLPAPAAEKIEGAFGLKLGQVFNPTTPLVKLLGRDEVYQFTPDQPNAMFSTYLVSINPKTHVVYEIVAGKEAPDGFDYDGWTRKMIAFLHARYGSLPSQERFVKQGERSVLVSSFTSPQGRQWCVVAYEDSELLSDADDERRMIAQRQQKEQQKELLKSVDPTGL